MSGSIWQTNAGIPIGFAADATEGRPPPLNRPLHYDGDRHITTIGPSGSGKTMRLLIPALHRLTGYSIVVNDLKGELCAMTRAHRQAAGSEIIVINPFDELGLGSTGYNPIAALETDRRFPDDAQELAESVVRVEGREPHWSQAAQELLTALIMYVRLVIPNGSFADVRDLLGQDHDGIRAMVQSPANFQFRGMSLPGMLETAIEEGWPALGNKAARFGDITPENRELLGVIGTALTQTRWLDSIPIREDLARNPFDFAALKERPITVYLILPADRLSSHSSWLRLVIGSIVQRLMRNRQRSRVPVMLMLDEFAALAGSSATSAEFAGDGFPAITGPGRLDLFRGYGLKLWTVWQSLAQAIKIYGDPGFQTILSNSGIIQTFAPGPGDAVTSEYISRISGQTTRQILTGGESLNPNALAPGGAQVSRNQNLGLIPMPLLLPHEIRSMDSGFSLIFSERAKGVVRSFVPWPGDVPALRQIMALNPSA